ncbi:MAG: tetratricopeptide repeat protein [Candidatus Thiodiazotropha sp. (ex Monitilora ramsayi)]|nr:tetratricopeptide repeat protein [Candidatus Thiodiazotropha sp. (ex Monitilora ramsayi)]
MTASPYIIDVTAENFQQAVLETSMSRPVLVDFWAEWCNPCKALMPALAKLAEGYQGKFILAKVNTEEQQPLANHFGIRSIPCVKLFLNGQMVDEFLGALPEPEIRNFIDKHIPRESDGLLAQAEQLLLQGDTETAGNLIQQAAQLDPGSPRVMLANARYLTTTGKLEEAEQQLLALPKEEQESPEAASMLARIQFDRSNADNPPPEVLEQRLQENPADSEALHQLASYKIMENDYETALELLLTLMQKDREYGDDAARKDMLRIFELLGGQGELVKRYRNRMFNALH